MKELLAFDTIYILVTIYTLTSLIRSIIIITRPFSHCIPWPVNCNVLDRSIWPETCDETCISGILSDRIEYANNFHKSQVADAGCDKNNSGTRPRRHFVSLIIHRRAQNGDGCRRTSLLQRLFLGWKILVTWKSFMEGLWKYRGYLPPRCDWFTLCCLLCNMFIFCKEIVWKVSHASTRFGIGRCCYL